MQPQIISGNNTQEFIITRELNAPRDIVFDAWSTSESMAQWWGPKGFELKVYEFDFRTGGVFHYSMSNNKGFTMWGKFYFREIVEPEKIVFINTFSDESGRIAKAPFFDGLWPLEVLNTVILTEHDGNTTLTLKAVPYQATQEERKKFIIEMPSMKQGYGGTFEKLENYLAVVKQ